jgi:ubiquinone/menaquinone biosynthesis C-methylase UbiE
MVYDKQEEKVKKYPRFLRDYYFSAKEKREEKIKKFYSAIPKNSIILEGACGKISMIKKFNSNASNIRMLIGIDLLKDSIRLNNYLDFKIVANLENLPFKEDFFDVVNLPNVVEHLQNPKKVFKEVNYVLKRGGILLISTKNIYNPFMAINKLLPIKTRYWIKKRILKSPGHYLDTFPAIYRCNSPMKLRKVLTNLGFKEEQIWLWGWPLIITFSTGLFFSMIYEKLTDRKWLCFSKPNIWARFKKI